MYMQYDLSTSTLWDAANLDRRPKGDLRARGAQRAHDAQGHLRTMQRVYVRCRADAPGRQPALRLLVLGLHPRNSALQRRNGAGALIDIIEFRDKLEDEL